MALLLLLYFPFSSMLPSYVFILFYETVESGEKRKKTIGVFMERKVLNQRTIIHYAYTFP